MGCRSAAAGFTGPLALLRNGDVLVTLAPVDEPDLTAGPFLVVEPVVLAVAVEHRLARRTGVTLDPVLRAARSAPPYWAEPPQLWCAPGGAPIRCGPSAGTFHELVALVGAGHGVCPLAAQAATYFSHPRSCSCPSSMARGWPGSWCGAPGHEPEPVRVLTMRALRATATPSRAPGPPGPRRPPARG